MNSDKPFVIYNSNIRWVAAVNMAFVVAGIWFALTHLDSGFPRYFTVGFLALYSLFWIRDLLFGFPLRLLSDGHALHWQEGKTTDSVPLADIRKVLIGVRNPVHGEGTSWTYVRFKLKSGVEKALPPNMASGLRARNWRLLKRLITHLRTVSNVTVEPINEPGLDPQGWKDEPDYTQTTLSSSR